MRTCLGLISLALCLICWRRKIGYLLLFSLSMGIQGAFLVSPAFVDNPGWLRLIQTPFAFFRLALAAAASVEVFWFMAAETYPAERRRLLAAALAIGAIPVWASWRFRPENWYQAGMIIREYALMWLTVSFLVAWLWVRWLRPVRTSLVISHHGTLWAMMISASAVTATMVKGGLFWIGMEWRGASDEWQFYGSVALMVQIWICVGFLLNLLNWPTGEASPGARPAYLNLRNLLRDAPLSQATARAALVHRQPSAG